MAGSTEKLPVAILGLGRIGHGFGAGPDGDPLSHSAAYRESGEAEIVAGVDVDPAARRAFAEAFPDARVAAHPDELPVGAARVVSVCTPDLSHAEDVRAALRLGADAILCEKPLAPTAAESEALAEACEKATCHLVVNYTRRFSPILQALRSALAEAAIGRPAGALLRYDGDLVHNGSHGVDLLLALMGAPASSRVEGDVLRLAWADGFEARLVPVAGTGFSIFEGEWWGSEGVLRLLEQGARLELDTATPSPWRGVRTLGARKPLCENGLRGHLLAAVREALRLAREGGTPSCSGRDAALVLRWIERGGAPRG